MKTTIAVLAALSAVAVAYSLIHEDSEPQAEILTYDDTKMHIFVLMVPETSVKQLKKKARQEEEGAAVVTETGVYVGQILQGVLGGDVRPIFAGSASFIGNDDVQQGVSTILANVAPSVNNVLKQWVNRVQVYLGLATTPRPGAAGAGNRTRPSNGVIVGRPITVAQASRLTPQQILAQQQLNEQQLAQQQIIQDIQALPQTVAGSNVLAGSTLFEFTTVPPLPLLTGVKPADKDEDENEEANVKRVL